MVAPASEIISGVLKLRARCERNDLLAIGHRDLINDSASLSSERGYSETISFGNVQRRKRRADIGDLSVSQSILFLGGIE